MFFKKPYFRPGAGSIIYNEVGQVLCFERSDMPGVWQFQQGGMDEGEEVVDTLWREMVEETGLTRDDFTVTEEFPDWTIYEYPPDMRARFGVSNTLGQVHRWFFLKLKPGTEIDLAKAADKEFKAWRWSDFSQVLAETGSMKYPVYEKLYTHFTTHIVKD